MEGNKFLNEDSKRILDENNKRISDIAPFAVIFVNLYVYDIFILGILSIIY